MPEGPELFLSSQFVNRIGQSHIFTGKVVKSEVSKSPDVEWNEKSYRIKSTSRGKEVQLILTAEENNINENEDNETKIKSEKKVKTLTLLFRFGMSGVFRFDPVNHMHKHAHLNFFTDSGKVLSFVDVRRFGRWEVGGEWGPERGPCVIQEYNRFRENVLNSLQDASFNKPICEAMLNQKYFNGIGNYLRAEILYRAGIKPFDKARTVLEQLVETEEVKVKSEKADFLQLCHIIPNEVINLEGKGYDVEAQTRDSSDFTKWLRCYYKPGMKNMVDHNGRTIWYDGDAGLMVPTNAKIKGRKSKGKTTKIKRTKVKKLADNSKCDEKAQNESDEPKPEKVNKPTKKVAENKQTGKPRKRTAVKNIENDELKPSKTKKMKKVLKTQENNKKTVNIATGTRRSSRLKKLLNE